MIQETKNVYQIFFALVQSYLDGSLTAVEFKVQYIQVWKKYRDSDEIYEINRSSDNSIDRVFTALDCYCEDEELRDEDDLDEESLKAEVEKIVLVKPIRTLF